MNKPYIINDADGNPINSKYPPNKELYGDEFGGYKNRTQRILFHDFVTSSIDISFSYNGIEYYFYVHNTPATVYNVVSKEIIAEYKNELELLENFKIDNRIFLEIIDEISDIKTFLNVFKPHKTLDADGYPCNCKYPPNKEKYGCLYHGYKDSFTETLLYDFGVQNYDLYFKYNGKEYYVLNEFNYVALCDEHFNKEFEVYSNEMDFIENFKIKGKPLIELIDKLEEIEPM